MERGSISRQDHGAHPLHTQALGDEQGGSMPSHYPSALPVAALVEVTLGSGTSSHLITFQRGSHQHHWPHGGHHIIWGDMFRLQN